MEHTFQSSDIRDDVSMRFQTALLLNKALAPSVATQNKYSHYAIHLHLNESSGPFGTKPSCVLNAVFAPDGRTSREPARRHVQGAVVGQREGPMIL